MGGSFFEKLKPAAKGGLQAGPAADKAGKNFWYWNAGILLTHFLYF